MKVLYTTDGFSSSADAGRLLTAIAKRDEVDVVVLAVAEHVTIPATESQSRERAAKVSEDAAARLRDGGLKAQTRQAFGSPKEKILEAAAEGFDLIVMGAGSKSWLGHLFLGNVSTGILHAAPCSVLFAHKVREGLGDRVEVLFGADGSEGAARAAEVFVALADPERARVHVLAVEADPMPGPVPPEERAASGAGDVERQLVGLAEQHLGAALEPLRAAGFVVTQESVIAHPPTKILETAENRRSDLVVVGSHGQGKVEEAVLGSVSDKIARHADAALIARRPTGA